MSELKKLKEEFQKKVETLQKNCKHGQFGGWRHRKEYSNELVRNCLRCGYEEKDVVHKWKCVGRTPSGGLAGGDDIYKCQRCGLVTDSPSEEQRWAYKPCEPKKGHE